MWCDAIVADSVHIRVDSSPEASPFSERVHHVAALISQSRAVHRRIKQGHANITWNFLCGPSCSQSPMPIKCSILSSETYLGPTPLISNVQMGTIYTYTVHSGPAGLQEENPSRMGLLIEDQINAAKLDCRFVCVSWRRLAWLSIVPFGHWWFIAESELTTPPWRNIELAVILHTAHAFMPFSSVSLWDRNWVSPGK